MLTARQENFLRVYLGVELGDGALERDAALLARGGPEGLVNAVQAELAGSQIAVLRQNWDMACRSFSADIASVSGIVRSTYSSMPEARSALAAAMARLQAFEKQVLGQLDTEIDQFLVSSAETQDALRSKIDMLQSLLATDPVAQAFDGNEFQSSTCAISAMRSALSEMAGALPT